MNFIKTLSLAKHLGIETIGMTGEGGDRGSVCDVFIDEPSKVMPWVQEMHLVIYHFLCDQIELALVKKVT